MITHMIYSDINIVAIQIPDYAVVDHTITIMVVMIWYTYIYIYIQNPIMYVGYGLIMHKEQVMNYMVMHNQLDSGLYKWAVR